MQGDYSRQVGQRRDQLIAFALIVDVVKHHRSSLLLGCKLSYLQLVCKPSSKTGFIYAIVGPPRLVPIQPLTERLLMVGDTLRLACPVVAVPRAIVTWEKDAKTVRPLAWERHHLNPDGLLIVRHLEVNDSGSYVCRATNGFGTVEFRFQVKILGK